VLPRAFLVPASGIEVVPGDGAQLDRVRAEDFDPAGTVIVAEPPVFGRDAYPDTPPAAPVVATITTGLNETRMTVAVPKPSVLVLSQTWYPGWRARVDGNPQPLLRVDYGFAGTAVGPGLHSVQFVYQPASLRYGAAATAAGLLICLWLWVSGGNGPK